MKAYCVKCKDKKEMKGPTPAKTAKGGDMVRGTCSSCGGNMVSFGKL